MGLYENWPYTNLHNVNLDWIITSMKQLQSEWSDFEIMHNIKFADPIEWSQTQPYDIYTVVLGPDGNSYLSKQGVPAGTLLTNTIYWAKVLDSNAKIVQEVTARETAIANEVTERKTAIANEVTERKTAIANEKYERTAEVAVERNRINNLIVSSGSDSSAEVIDARLGYDGTSYKILGNAIRTSDKKLKLKIKGLFEGKYTLSYEDGDDGYYDANLNYHKTRADEGTAGYKCYHLGDIDFISSIYGTTLIANAGIVFAKKSDGTIDKFGLPVGYFKVIVSEYTDIYINFYTTGTIGDITIEYNDVGNKIKEYLEKSGADEQLILAVKGLIEGKRTLSYEDSDDGYYDANLNYQQARDDTGTAGYKCYHLTNLNFVNTISGTALKSSGGIVLAKKSDGTIDKFGIPVGDFTVRASDYVDIYINFYAIGFVGDITIEYAHIDTGTRFKKYQSGYINFTVPVRQTKSNNDVASTSESELNDDSIDVTCVLKLPTSYSVDKLPVPLVMICHGAGKNAVDWSNNVNYNNLVNTFVNDGYAVFDCNGFNNDGVGYNFWGDSRGVSAWRKAYQYIINNYNIEHQFCLYGFSMGGLTALNLAFSNFPNIKCIALGSPVVSLEACYNDSTVKDIIKNLYGMGETYNKSLAYGCDPYSHILTLNDKNYIFSNLSPLKIWFGGTETGSGTDTGTDLLVNGCVNKNLGKAIVTAINNAGGMAEFREIEGAGHEICYGENTNAANDYLLYFNRFTKI